MIEVGRLIIDNVIACDDIRREHNGKFILIGVYNNAVRVHASPARFTLSFYLAGRVSDAKDATVLIRLDDDDEMLGTMTVGLNDLDDRGRIAITTPRLNFEFEDPTTVRLSMNVDDGEWVEVLRLPVIFDESVSDTPQEFETKSAKRKR